jgi:hypothetical protein
VTLELCETLGLVLLQARGTTAAALLSEEKRPFEDVPRFGTLLLTALAWHAARGRIAIDRLPADVVADFLRTTASRRTADREAPARAMTRLVDALADESRLARLPVAALRRLVPRASIASPPIAQIWIRERRSPHVSWVACAWLRETDMPDEPLKSAYELAMERLKAKDREDGIVEEKPLTAPQKERIAELRLEAKAKLAELEILHRKNLAATGAIRVPS